MTDKQWNQWARKYLEDQGFPILEADDPILADVNKPRENYTEEEEQWMADCEYYANKTEEELKDDDHFTSLDEMIKESKEMDKYVEDERQ